ncbi:hypothetical protein HOS76_gp13 [Pseudomonas phage Henninger]|uniref:Uncharacterized protein n=1 Tax=Pseudomonas phage Henninger TaxID=2079287 RepID=A0A2K9VHB9_9CAUD|nr:hypothetical protein HOS76_gp13 [Pseudomonas phage Henninger]AUV61707.1 hypothetical protein PsPhHenninger_gp40 [Pseudomonas phage Henninger]
MGLCDGLGQWIISMGLREINRETQWAFVCLYLFYLMGLYKDSQGLT